MDVILFLVFAIIAVVAAINVVVQTHPISSALSLVGVMGSLAVLYLLLGAEFIAAAQVIVYAGAVMVLCVFVIMLLTAGTGPVFRGQATKFPAKTAGKFRSLPPKYCQPAEARKVMLAAVPIEWFLLLSAVLFALGVAGFLFRRNIITVFMSIELMLNAVNLTFIAFSYQLKQVNGQIFSLFVTVVAAAEAAVGLAIILTVFKNRATLNIDDVNSMKN